jgi:predicted Zn-dependent protease
MEEDIVDYALDYSQSKKIEYAEARGQSQVQDGLMLRNGVLDAYVSAVDSGFCVRILSGGGIGFASTNKWTREEARNLVDLAFKHAKLATRKSKIVFAQEKGAETKWVVEQKRRV